VAGEPRQVDEPSALRIALQERLAYAQAISGHLGEDKRSEASLMRLGGIVEMRVRRPGGWEVVDMIEGKRFFRPHSYKAVPRHKSREEVD